MRLESLVFAVPLVMSLGGGACAQVVKEHPKVELSQIAEHMEVIGADGRHVGTVDKVEGSTIELTKSDPAARGTHHAIPYAWVDTIADGKLRLKKSASEAMAAWDQTSRPSDDPKK